MKLIVLILHTAYSIVFYIHQCVKINHCMFYWGTTGLKGGYSIQNVNLFKRDVNQVNCSLVLLLGLIASYISSAIFIQITGLYGTNGILPARTQLLVKGTDSIFTRIKVKPTLLWFAPLLGLNTEYMMDVLALAGTSLGLAGWVHCFVIETYSCIILLFYHFNVYSGLLSNPFAHHQYLLYFGSCTSPSAKLVKLLWSSNGLYSYIMLYLLPQTRLYIIPLMWGKC